MPSKQQDVSAQVSRQDIQEASSPKLANDLLVIALNCALPLRYWDTKSSLFSEDILDNFGEDNRHFLLFCLHFLAALLAYLSFFSLLSPSFLSFLSLQDITSGYHLRIISFFFLFLSCLHLFPLFLSVFLTKFRAILTHYTPSAFSIVFRVVSRGLIVLLHFPLLVMHHFVSLFLRLACIFAVSSQGRQENQEEDVYDQMAGN